MLGILFLSLKDNLIAKGLPEDKIFTFESYLIGKNRFIKRKTRKNKSSFFYCCIIYFKNATPNLVIKIS